MSRVHVQMLALVILLAVVAGSVLDKPASPGSELEVSELGLIRALRSMSDADVKRLQKRGWWGRGRGSAGVSASTADGGSLNAGATYTNGNHQLSASGSTANGGSAQVGYTYTFGKGKRNGLPLTTA